MNNILSQLFYFIVKLLKVFVNRVLSSHLMLEGLLLWTILELFIVYHELLCFSILYNTSSTLVL